MGLKPLRARILHALSRLVNRRVPVRGVVCTDPRWHPTRWELLRLRALGLIPTIAGGSGEGEGEDRPDEGADRARVEPAPATPERTDEPKSYDETYVTKLRRERDDYRGRALKAERALSDLTDASTTDGEKLEAALAENATLKGELWRLRAAVKHNVPDDLTDLLSGESEDEVLQQAERLAKRLVEKAKADVPTPERGARRTELPGLDEQIAEAQARGDWDTAGALKAQKLAAVRNKT